MPLKNRNQLSSTIRPDLDEALKNLSKETRIPQTKLIDEAIELLLQKYKKLPTDKQLNGDFT